MPGSGLFDSDALVAVLESAASPMVAVDLDDVIHYVNPAAAEAFGWERDQLIGMRTGTLVPPEQVEEHRELFASWAEDPVVRSRTGIDLRAQRRDGTTFPVEVSVTPVQTSHGELALVGMVDISARLDAERAVRDLARAHLAMAQLNDAAARTTEVDPLLDAGLEAFARVDERAGVALVRADHADLAPRLAAALAAGGDTASPYVVPADGGSSRVAVLPLLRDGAVLARVVVSSTGDLLDDPSMRSLLETMAANLSGALDRLSQRDRLRRVNAQRIDLFRRLLDAQDEERRRIADDVHDDSVQALAALQLRVGLLTQQVQDAGLPLVDACDEIGVELGRVMAGLRALLFELEPVSTASSMLDVVSEVLGGIPVDGLTVREVEVDWSAYLADEHGADQLDLPPHLRGQAARILKEALRNVARHAFATWVQVRLTPDPDGLSIAVVDDGVGLPVDADAVRSAPGHRGVASMLDRAALCGGWCSLERDRDCTVLRFWLPRDGLDPRRVLGPGGE